MYWDGREIRVLCAQNKMALELREFISPEPYFENKVLPAS